jgi:hypothetical protein
LKALEDEKSELNVMINGAMKAFNNRRSLFIVANQLKIADTEIHECINLPLINGNKEIMASIIF